jgi:hypothetical protein
MTSLKHRKIAPNTVVYPDLLSGYLSMMPYFMIFSASYLAVQ